MTVHSDPRPSPNVSIPALLFLVTTSALAATPGWEVSVRALGPHAVAAPVRLGGGTAWMLVDTGATRSRISAALAMRLELRPTARHTITALDGTERTAACRGPLSLDLAGVELRVDCLSWSTELPIPLGLDGVLGADVLASADLLLDTTTARLRVAPSGSLLPWVEGTTMPVRLIEGRPALPATWQSSSTSRAGDLVLDSGADSPIFFGDLARDLRSSRHLATPLVVQTAGDAIGASAIRLRWLQVGPRTRKRVTSVLLPDVEDRREAGLLPSSLLGPTLFALGDGVVVAGARLRRRPAMPQALTPAVWLAP